MSLYANMAFDDASGWSLGGVNATAVIDDSLGHRTSRHALVLAAGTAITGFGGGGEPIYGPSQTTYASQGAVLDLRPTFVSFWAKKVASGSSLTIEAIDDDTSTVITSRVITDAMGTGDWQPVCLAFIPLASTTPTNIVLSAGDTGPRGYVGFWAVDDGWAELYANPEVPMPVSLSERLVVETTALMQAYLPTYIAMVASDRGDSLGLAAPDKWFDYAHPAFVAAGCQVEVFERGVEFTAAESDGSAGQITTTEASLAIRISHANRDNASPHAMVTRSRRYAAAIYDVLRDYPSLYSTNADTYALVTSADLQEIEASYDDEGRRVADRVTFRVVVRQTETKAGENTPGGGAMPAYPVAID